MNTKDRNRLFTVLKFLVTVIPLIFIFRLISFRDLVSALAGMEPWTVLAFVFAVLASMFIQGARWWILLRAYVPDLGLGRTLYYHFTGLFYSIVLPSAAQDVVRTVLISRKIDYSAAWGATWICKIFGIVSMLILSGYGLWSLGPTFPPAVLWVILGIAGISTILLAASFSKKLTRPIRFLLGRFIPKETLTIPEKVREGIYLYKGKKGAVGTAFIISVAMQVIVVMGLSVAIKGISGSFHFVECLAFVPLIEMISVGAAITPNGMGIREGLSALMFQQMGLSVQELGAYVILTVFANFLRVVGGIPILFELFSRKKKKESCLPQA